MEGQYLFDRETQLWIKERYESRIDYSDGTEVEQQILEALRKCSDVSVLSEELESYINNWPSLCFFSKKRANLLRPFASLFKGKYILEVGCGAGAITRFLGECGAYVYAIEPSLQRAKMAAERCRDLPNVTIFCDDIGSFECDRKFDGIVQVGVLEYATRYSADSNATLQFLTHLKKYLAEDGFLITAIENQLGLKYFSGYLEDHAGVMMHNINNNYQPGEATTLGRKKLMSVFEQAGFGRNDLFLPFPDYKMPTLIIYPGFNEKNRHCNINIESILSNISYQDPQQYMPLFSLDKALPLIAQNDLLYDLSNSFCIFSQNTPTQPIDEDILFTFYRTDLKKEYCKQTLFKKEGNAVKVVRNYLVDSASRKDALISFDEEEPAYSGILHHYGLVEIINRDHWTIEQVGEWLTTWFNCLKKELTDHHGFTPTDFSQADLLVNGRFIDALPINLLIQEAGYRFIDLEIDLHQDLELGYLIFRAVCVGLSRLSSIAQPQNPAFSNTEDIFYALFEYLGYTLHPDLLDSYYELEAGLVSNVTPVQRKTIKGNEPRLRVRPAMGDIQNSMGRIESLEKQLRSLEGQLVSIGNHVETLEDELEYKKANIDDLNELVHKKQNQIAGLYHEIHSLSTSRKRMMKQLIKRTLPFLNIFF